MLKYIRLWLVIQKLWIFMYVDLFHVKIKVLISEILLCVVLKTHQCMRRCMHTYIRMYVCMYVLRYLHTHTYIRTYIQYVYAYILLCCVNKASYVCPDVFWVTCHVETKPCLWHVSMFCWEVWKMKTASFPNHCENIVVGTKVHRVKIVYNSTLRHTSKGHKICPYYQGWFMYMRYTQGQNEGYLLSRSMY